MDLLAEAIREIFRRRVRNTRQRERRGVRVACAKKSTHNSTLAWTSSFGAKRMWRLLPLAKFEPVREFSPREKILTNTTAASLDLLSSNQLSGISGAEVCGNQNAYRFTHSDVCERINNLANCSEPIPSPSRCGRKIIIGFFRLFPLTVGFSTYGPPHRTGDRTASHDFASPTQNA